MSSRTRINTTDCRKTTIPEGLRDTTNFYAHVNPMAVVDHSLADYVHEHGGQELLDLGCGLGGYSKVLMGHGHKVTALDVNEKYVEIAKELGVDAMHFDGETIPLSDNSVDTIFMIEVMEHITNPERILREVHRVARQNVIITVPNCTQSFKAPITFTHHLDIDHKNFFTKDSLRELLQTAFRTVDVIQEMPIDRSIADELLPRWALLLWRVGHKLRLFKDHYYFRLIANGSV
jgi:ubiquinone/menaquinone biosynthesis C-methylase UbiE